LNHAKLIFLYVYLKKYLAKRHPHLPAAAEGGDKAVGVLRQESKVRHELLHLDTDHVEVDVLRPALQQVELVEEAGHEVHVLGGGLERGLHPVEAPLDLHLLLERAEELLPDGAGGGDLELLAEERDLHVVLGLDDGAGVGVLEARDDAELRRLAGAVDADEARLLAALHLPGHVLEHRHALVRLGDVLQAHPGRDARRAAVRPLLLAAGGGGGVGGEEGGKVLAFRILRLLIGGGGGGGGGGEAAVEGSKTAAAEAAGGERGGRKGRGVEPDGAEQLAGEEVHGGHGVRGAGAGACLSLSVTAVVSWLGWVEPWREGGHTDDGRSVWVRKEEG
jgi:hypothetical protein